MNNKRKFVSVTDTRVKQEHQMAKSMFHHLSVTKGIACKIVNIHEGKVVKVKDQEDTPHQPEYKVVGVPHLKNSLPFNWELYFDREDIDEKDRFTRHMELETSTSSSSFKVTTNGQLMLLLENYEFKSNKLVKEKEKMEKVALAEAKKKEAEAKQPKPKTAASIKPKAETKPKEEIKKEAEVKA